MAEEYHLGRDLLSSLCTFFKTPSGSGCLGHACDCLPVILNPTSTLVFSPLSKNLLEGDGSRGRGLAVINTASVGGSRV